MKTISKTPRLLIILCCTFATTAVFGQTTYTWSGAANSTNLATAGNWDPNGQPDGSTQDTAQWDGRTTTNLLISYTGGLPGTGYGSMGINFVLTPNQDNSVQIISPIAQSGNIGLFGITNDSTSAALIVGDDTAHRLNFVGRPASAVHYLVNNSTTPAVISQSVRWQAGGGTSYTLEFGGSGDWTVNNYLRNDNNAGATTVAVDGPGTVYWAAAGAVGNSAIGPVNLNGGTLVLKSHGLLANQAIADNATLQYDAPSESQTLGGVISGTGLLKVSKGTLTLSSAASTFSGNIELADSGTLVVGGAENVGVSGPLGAGGTISFTGGTLQFSVNNTFDYSPRFSSAASQAYHFDTAGLSVTFTNGLSSSGGTLTKSGSGTLTLSGANTYSGTTTVSGGKLVFEGSKSGSGDITVADGAVLGVAATGAQVTPGTLTVGTSSGATLEFNNVNSTTTALLAADTLSSAGTVTININSGTFTIGQSYPLLSWTGGSAPAVSLGSVSGAVGNLSTNGNTISLNITALAFLWSGANNGTWDTSTANNWLFAGSTATYSDSSPVVFDDTASGTTDVTVNGVVQPSVVAVNSSTKNYSITSSSGNNIGGSASLTKNGDSTLTLSGGANTYTGMTTISGGTVSVGTLANGGSASDIGAASSSAANLVLNGGTLQYSGGAVSVDRSFTVGTGGGAIDASGSGALNLNSTGPVGLNGVGSRVLTLTGTSTNDNTLAAALGDSSATTSLTKIGAGTWVLTGTNTYSGATTIAEGTLQVGTGGTSGSVGSGDIVDNGSLIFNRTGTLTNGTVSGTGSVTVQGGGTVVLPGDNTYSGSTTISSGTLQVGDGGATGTLGNGAIANDGTLIFDSTGNYTRSAGTTISGTGQLIKRGSGLLKLIGNETYTGNTTVDAGARLQIAEGNQGSFAGEGTITDNGSLIFVRQDTGGLFITNNIVGTGSVTKDVNNTEVQGDVTLVGTNTYTGGTIIRGGTVILGDGVTPNAGSIVGDVLFTNSALGPTVRTLTFYRAYGDDVTFSGNITGAGSIVQNGYNTLTLTGTNNYSGGTTINSGTLQVGNGGASGSVGTGNITDNGTLIFNRSDDMSLSGDISGAGALVKTGAGTLTLFTNTLTGLITVSNGTLVVNGDSSSSYVTVNSGTLGGTGAFYGPVVLNAGTTLAPGDSIGTLTFNGGLTISGNLAIEVNTSLSQSNDFVVAAPSTLYNTGTGTLTVSNLGPTLVVGEKFTLFNQALPSGDALTVTGGGATWVNNLAVDGSISVATVTEVKPPMLGFTPGASGLQFSWTGSYKLQVQTNRLDVGLSTNWADYPGGSTSPITVPIDGTAGTVFFRLAPTP